MRGKGGFRGFQFVMPKLQPQIHSQRYPSHVQRNIWLSIPQPFSLHIISIAERDDRQSDSSPLVKGGCPSFRNVAAAAGELLYDERASDGRREPGDIQVRVAHSEAMIERVHLQAASASITVTGTNVSGVRLEINSEPKAFCDRRLRRAGLQRFPFPQGLPERMWIMLSRKDSWLDYRDLNLRGSRLSTDDDLEIDPADNTAQIEGFIFRGESETIEFKQEVSNDKGTSFLRTVAAFANASGGVILLGVVNQTGEVRGINGDV
jgi:hypothetical protein